MRGADPNWYIRVKRRGWDLNRTNAQGGGGQRMEKLRDKRAIKVINNCYVTSQVVWFMVNWFTILRDFVDVTKLQVQFEFTKIHLYVLDIAVFYKLQLAFNQCNHMIDFSHQTTSKSIRILHEFILLSTNFWKLVDRPPIFENWSWNSDCSRYFRMIYGYHYNFYPI